MTESLRELIERHETDANHYGLTRTVHTSELRELLDAFESLLTEYEKTCNPAPYTTERALYERVRGLVIPPARGAS